MISADAKRALVLVPLALAAGCGAPDETAPRALEGRWRHVQEDGVASIEGVVSFDAGHGFESAMTVRYRDDASVRPGCVTTRMDTGSWSTDGPPSPAAA